VIVFKGSLEDHPVFNEVEDAVAHACVLHEVAILLHGILDSLADANPMLAAVEHVA